MDRETRRRFEAWRAERRPTRRTRWSTTSSPVSAIAPASSSARPCSACRRRRSPAALLAQARRLPRSRRRPRGKAGGRLRLGLTPIPKGSLEPWTYQETVALQLGGISGEFLIRNKRNLTLVPELAVSWKPNATASEWTYKLRQGVKFANGKPMTADDVIATYKRLLTDPDSQADLRVQRHALRGGHQQGRRLHDQVQAGHAVRELLVPHELDDLPGDHPARRTTSARSRRRRRRRAPSTSSPTPRASARATSATRTGGAAQRRSRASTARSATTRPSPTRCSAARSTSSRASSTSADSRALFNNPNIQIWKHQGATHREIPMRVDQNAGVLKDKRVRQAIALTLDRPQIIKTLFNGIADLGNDSPFAPVYPSTVGPPGVAQRHKDIRKAKELIAAAGLKPRAGRRSSSPTRRPSCPTSPRSSSSRSRRSAATSPSRSRRARSTTRARRRRCRG